MIPCPLYVHELNGVAERYNRSIMDMARCLLKEAKVNRMYWPEIIKAVAYLKNTIIANTIENKSPFEIFFKEKRNVNHLKIYGSKIFVRILEQLRKSKWDDKAKLGILLGYTETGYRILVNNRIIDVRHVDVIEEGVKCIGLSDDETKSDIEALNENEIEQSLYQNKIEQSSESSKSIELNKIQDLSSPTDEIIKRSSRNKIPISKYFNDEYVTNFICVNYCMRLYRQQLRRRLSPINQRIGKKLCNLRQ